LHTASTLHLASTALKAIKDRNHLDPIEVDDVVMGCVDPVGEAGGDIARMGALAAGFGQTVPGVQINRFCASGLDAVNFAAAQIMSGQQDMAIGGGVESMSRVGIGASGGAWAVDPTIAVEHYFPDEDMGDPLLCSGVRAGRIPGGRQIAGERNQRCAIDLWAKGSGNIVSGDAILKIGNPLQRRVPPGLEFARDQPLGRIDHFVAAGGQRGVITRFLKLPTKRLPDLAIGLLGLIGGLDCGVDRVFRNGFDDLSGDGTIDPYPSDTDAQPSADMTVVTPAVVTVGVPRPRPVEHPHRAAATAAAHQAGQQRSTAAR